MKTYADIPGTLQLGGPHEKSILGINFTTPLSNKAFQ